VVHRKRSAPADQPKREVAFIPRNKPKYTEEEVAAALKECGGFVYATAYYLDINPSTMITYMKRWPNLRKVKKNCKNLMLDRVENSLWIKAMKGDVRACKLILFKEGEKRGWKAQTKNYNVEHKVTTVEPPVLSDEDRNKILDAVKARWLEQQKRVDDTLHALESGLKELPAPADIVDAEIIHETKEVENEQRDG
jgi:hypothetical protein